MQDDSGTETDATPSVVGSDEGKEEEQAELHSPPDTPGPRTYRPLTDGGNGSPVTRATSHSATVAANRGLQIQTDRTRHPSAGLPVSPRPMQATTTNISSPRPAPRGPNSGTYPRDPNV